jgi:hypothetical protein
VHGVALAGGLLADGSWIDKDESPKGLPFPLFGVSKTVLLSPAVPMGGLMHLLGVPCPRTPDRSS